MATHSSTLAWKILWTEKPGRLQSMGSQRVEHIRLKQQQTIFSATTRGTFKTRYKGLSTEPFLLLSFSINLGTFHSIAFCLEKVQNDEYDTGECFTNFSPMN